MLGGCRNRLGPFDYNDGGTHLNLWPLEQLRQLGDVGIVAPRFIAAGGHILRTRRAVHCGFISAAPCWVVTLTLV